MLLQFPCGFQCVSLVFSEFNKKLWSFAKDFVGGFAVLDKVVLSYCLTVSHKVFSDCRNFFIVSRTSLFI